MKKPLLLRILLALVYGAAISALSLNAAWDQAQYSAITYPFEIDRGAIKSYVTSIEAFKQKNHRLPIASDFMEMKYDSWAIPMCTGRWGGRYYLAALGRDGKPGGTGLDVDITNDNFKVVRCRVTFSQFLHHPATGAMVLFALLNGLPAGLHWRS